MKSADSSTAEPLPGTPSRGVPLLRRFAGHDALVEVLSAGIARRLRRGIALRGQASLLVPGGHTPAPFLERLSQQALDWGCVTASLTDERLVPPCGEASNERLLRRHLLHGEAARARIIGLWNDAADPAAQGWQALAGLPRPFDAVVLGMGEDGHIASLFPQDPASITAIDLSQAPGCRVTHAPVAPVQRLSLNLAALLQARAVVLLITGAPKWELLQSQLEGATGTPLPVRALLDQALAPLTVYWSPSP